MAGILANSATKTMVSGDTAVDKDVVGYITGETTTLTTYPTGSTYSWAIAKPSGSTARANLSDDTGASVSFTPDVAGYYTVTCTVDSTTAYIIQISVTQVATATTIEALRVSPKLPAMVSAPTMGAAIFFDSGESLLSRKIAGGAYKAIETRAYTPSGNGDAEGQTGDVAFDSSYVYVKTAAGWKRAALATF